MTEKSETQTSVRLTRRHLDSLDGIHNALTERGLSFANRADVLRHCIEATAKAYGIEHPGGHRP